jgi:molybdopterin molybdotransferase
VSKRAPSIAAALATMFERLVPTEAVTSELDAALGLTLADEVRADVDLPLWDNAAMDGYACIGEDIAGADASTPVQLPVTGTVAAGSFSSRPVSRGEAIRIMTGAPVPPGADSVIRVEDTDAGDRQVSIRSSRDTRANIRRRGEDVRVGDLLVGAGMRLRASELAMLAAAGNATLRTHRAPRVGILASGDELVPVSGASELLAGKRVISANSYSLAAIVTEAGGEPLDLGIVPDSVDALLQALRRAAECDLLVTSGGISVGGFDLVRAAIEKAGGMIHFWRVPMRPGYNSAFGEVHGRPWLGVPGNSVSALVAGEVLLRPAIRRLCGAAGPLRARTPVAAAERINRARDTLFLRAALDRTATGLPRARLAGPQGSAILSTSVKADALIEIRPGSEPVEPGEEVDAIVLRDEAGI